MLNTNMSNKEAVNFQPVIKEKISKLLCISFDVREVTIVRNEAGLLFYDAEDIAANFEYANVNEMLFNIESQEQLSCTRDASQMTPIIYITESAVFQSLIHSSSPKSEQFCRWTV